MKFVIYDPVDEEFWGVNERWVKSADGAVVFTASIPTIADYQEAWEVGRAETLNVDPPIPSVCRRSRLRLRHVSLGVRLD